MRLTLKHDEPLSKNAYNFNLRRYIMEVLTKETVARMGGLSMGGGGGGGHGRRPGTVGGCRLTLSNPR